MMLKQIVRPRLTLMALALLLAASQVVVAQDPNREGRGRRGGGFGGGPMGFVGRGGGPEMMQGMLLRSEAVQKELGLSEDQQKQLTAAAEESREQMREFFGRGRDLSDEERAKLREQMEQARQKAQERVSTILSADQSRRLSEIALQLEGTRAVGRDDIAGKLGLSAEQKQSVRDIFSAQREMMQDLFGNIRDLEPEQRREKFEEMRKKGEELQAETNTAVLEVLTAEQKAKFDELKGKPFDVDRSELFRGGFGGGRRGPGGQDGQRRRSE